VTVPSDEFGWGEQILERCRQSKHVTATREAEVVMLMFDDVEKSARNRKKPMARNVL